MMIIMKGAQALMPAHAEPESLRDCLNGQFTKLLKFIFFHFF